MANSIGDVVLIYYREEPTFFARIDSIEPDIKKGWFRVQLLVLTIPLETIAWILREEYINGVPFTMEGKPLRIEAVITAPVGRDSENAKSEGIARAGPDEQRKIIPFQRSKQDDTGGS